MPVQIGGISSGDANETHKRGEQRCDFIQASRENVKRLKAGALVTVPADR